jgi:hypothetical protein
MATGIGALLCTMSYSCKMPANRCNNYVHLYLEVHHHSFLTSKAIHSLVFSLRGRVGRNQSPVMWPVWLWHTASWASSWG